MFKLFTQISGNWKTVILKKSWKNSSICLFLLLRNSFFFKETSKKGWILRVHSLNQQQQKSLVRSDFYDLLITDKNSIYVVFMFCCQQKQRLRNFLHTLAKKKNIQKLINETIFMIYKIVEEPSGLFFFWKLICLKISILKKDFPYI